MTVYKEINGTDITVVTSDPSNPVTGQVWYNTTTQKLKGYQQILSNAWSTSGNMNTARYRLSGNGTQTSALGYGGNSPPYVTITEAYDGSSWTEVNDMNTSRKSGGGIGADSTAALSFGGENTDSSALTATEIWNGTNWTEVNDLNTGRETMGASGLSTSGLAYGGLAPPGIFDNTESWNGTNWTEVSDLNTARRSLAGAGSTNTAALAFGGLVPATPANMNETEEWNGSSWTEVNNLNFGRPGLTGVGLFQYSALAVGGEVTRVLGNTESWNGTNWTEVNNLNIPRESLAGAGSGNTSGLVFGGYSTALTAATEEWNAGQAVGAWTTGGTANTARQATGAAGVQTAMIAFGGFSPAFAPPPAARARPETESYNGTAWAEVNDLNTARNNLSGAGTQTAG